MVKIKIIKLANSILVGNKESDVWRDRDAEIMLVDKMLIEVRPKKAGKVVDDPTVTSLLNTCWYKTDDGDEFSGPKDETPLVKNEFVEVKKSAKPRPRPNATKKD